MRRLLVDTNVVVWLLLGDRARVSDVARQALEDERNRVAVSAATVWEIAVKRSVGKLTIQDGWARTLGRLGFDALPVTAIHAEAVERLPWHHRDPFDRLLVAQAATERLALVSADARLAAYEIDVVW
ncbi:MAG TPA: type II toxin-antitoxin system VapC family toxin [Thermoleophilaceae bacterium]|nr:type II toxin-antitoxin system VapC family toxin [Thermoleophilaceae bacterium]